MTQAISRLPVPEEETLPEDIQALFAKSREKPGFVPNVYQALSLRPQALRGFLALYSALMEQESGLSKTEREMIAVVVSAENHCFYCLVSHGAALRVRSKDAALADTIAANYRAADLSLRQRAMLDFAVKVTNDSARCDEADIAALRTVGFSDEDIADIAQIAAFFNYSNRFASALALRPNQEFFTMAR
ncbi:peroxidase-related enzyme [Candidatus Gracilibacteria bacterium]|nr:peroxidase-related enzyme [Candidatus Gracilibacteria bacterium]